MGFNSSSSSLHYFNSPTLLLPAVFLRGAVWRAEPINAPRDKCQTRSNSPRPDGDNTRAAELLIACVCVGGGPMCVNVNDVIDLGFSFGILIFENMVFPIFINFTLSSCYLIKVQSRFLCPFIPSLNSKVN